MSIKYEQVLRVCEILSEQPEVLNTIKESAKAGAFAFSGAAIGGLFAGPVGALIGGVACSTANYYMSANKYKSIPNIIKNHLTYEEKQRLGESVSNLIRNIDATDVVTILAIINSQPTLKAAVVNQIRAAIGQHL